MNVYLLTPKDSFGSNMYIAESNGEYAVIDPSVDFYTAVEIYPKLRQSTKYIILTHAHFDHFLGLNSWAEETDATVLVGKFDAPALTDSYKNAYRIFFGKNDGYFGKYSVLNHNDSLTLGEEKITVLATPGHTPGGISLLFDSAIFVGDTVFEGGAWGRCDLPGGDVRELFNSIKLICSQNARLTVYSGHGNASTIKEIRKHFDNF